jgi:tricorn protease
MVEDLSNGRLGYLHIQGMDIPSFEEFERNLYAAGHGKEGLIIDVRSNGGGWTTDYLMAVLGVRRHAFTIPRDEDPEVRAYPQGRLPLAAWTRPAAVLCNEESYSNAEIFSHAFRSLDRGVLVGVPTFGAVISTGGMRLLDGGWVRLPLRGWYVADTGMNMENNGAVPDVVVPQPPAQDTAPDEDAQLARAVEELLARMENDPRRDAW